MIKMIHEGSSCVAFSTGCIWPNTSHVVFTAHISTIVLLFSIDVVLILSIWIQIWMIFHRYMRDVDEMNPIEDFIYKIPGIHIKRISIHSLYTCLYNRLHDETPRLTNDDFICHNFSALHFSMQKHFPLIRYLLNIHTKLYQTIQRWIDIMKQIEDPELLMYFSF